MAMKFPSYTEKYHSSTYDSINPTRPELSLAGKTAVVTGGGTGVGFEICLALAKAGVSKLAIIGRRLDVLNAAIAKIASQTDGNTDILAFPADITKQDQVNNAFDEIKKVFGGELDLLVQNAAAHNGMKEIKDETDEELDSLLGVNIKSVFFLARAFVRNAKKDAKIINVSSAVIHIPPIRGIGSYTISKIAGTKIMEYVAEENPDLFIVDLHPGQVNETEMAERFIAGRPHADDAELPGHFIVWLASPEAKFLKGRFVWANWDVDELKAKASEIEGSNALKVGLMDWPKFF